MSPFAGSGIYAGDQSNRILIKSIQLKIIVHNTI